RPAARLHREDPASDPRGQGLRAARGRGEDVRLLAGRATRDGGERRCPPTARALLRWIARGPRPAPDRGREVDRAAIKGHPGGIETVRREEAEEGPQMMYVPSVLACAVLAAAAAARSAETGDLDGDGEGTLAA